MRVQFEGANYHITSRGNGRRKIYYGVESREKFLELLAQTLSRYNWICHAYCLMDNHYHLMIETREANLSLGMRHLNGVYTQWVNRRYKRVGHVMQGRFKGILVEKERHLLELTRYVVLNPVRAKMVERPEEYRWSSYCGTVEYKQKMLWLQTDWILGQFGDNKGKAVQGYKEFVREGMKKKDNPWDNLTGQIYYGSKAFIKGIEIKGKDEALREIPRKQKLAVKRELEEIVKEGSGKEILEAVREGFNQREIAGYLGIHYSVVSRRLKKEETKQ